MEQILQYVWKHKLFQMNLKTTDGVPIEIIDIGLQNTNAGPDFSNVKIKVGEQLWVGNVEIHQTSKDWYKHKHHEDKAYNSVILHIVEFADKDVLNENGLSIPQCEISYSREIKNNIEFLLRTDIPISCCNYIGNIESIYIKNWLDALIIERLERKTNDLKKILERYNNSWSHVFYILLCRHMGFGLNTDAFELLGHSIPINSLLKQADNTNQLEAILLGQAGLLEDLDSKEEYIASLTNEYKFLKNKYQLKSLDKSLFKFSRMRPSSSIYIRIAQLAALLQNIQGLPRKILESKDVGQIRLLFHVNASEYWQTHYNFESVSTKKHKYIGDSSLDILIINVVVPFLFSYGSAHGNEEYINKAINILEKLKPENNFIIKLFSEYGLKVNTASDSQALIQLKREYCEKNKCLYCKIGYHILSKSNI